MIVGREFMDPDRLADEDALLEEHGLGEATGTSDEIDSDFDGFDPIGTENGTRMVRGLNLGSLTDELPEQPDHLTA